MQTILESALLFVAAISLSSCFVSLPSKGTSKTAKYHGNTVRFTEALDIVNGYNSNWGMKHPAGANIGSNQRVLKTIPAKTSLLAQRTNSSRLPAGIYWSLVCYSPTDKIKFEVSEGDLEQLGITIVNKEKENKSEMATPSKPSD